jgi:hypothetical protein
VKLKYTQRLIDLVYERGCIESTVVVRILAEEFGVPPERYETFSKSVHASLATLAQRGVLVRVRKGLYCRPGATVQPKTSF